ncbi:MAG: OmpH family outer membrane protein [Terriglobales bacterium]|jgi:outer membrane protein
MIKKFAHVTVIVAAVFGLSMFALAQAAPAAKTPAAAAPPNAPSSAAQPVTKFTGTKIGTLAVEQAIAASNEGQRDLEALSKKFEPKQSELKGMNDEIDSLQKQLNTQQDKLNDESRDKLVKQIEAKKKSFDRAAEDAKEDFQNQAGEIENRILQKMVPIIQKYVTDNGYGLLLDTDQAMTWPRGAVILAGPSMDITQQVVDAYNAQSGVAAPPAGSTTPKPAKPAGTKTPASTPPKQ